MGLNCGPQTRTQLQLQISVILRSLKSRQRYHNRNFNCIGHILSQCKGLQRNHDRNFKP